MIGHCGGKLLILKVNFRKPSAHVGRHRLAAAVHPASTTYGTTHTTSTRIKSHKNDIITQLTPVTKNRQTCENLCLLPLFTKTLTSKKQNKFNQVHTSTSVTRGRRT